jgi:preprotein translocase subunit SecG
MFGFVLALHVLVCLVMVVVILLPSGKGGGLAGAFGGGGSTIFGGRGATTVLTRATMVLGVLFFVTSLSLALMSGGTRTVNRSLLQEEARRTGAAAPTAPTTMPQRTLPQGGAPAGSPAATPAPAPAPTSAPATPAPAAPAGGGAK